MIKTCLVVFPTRRGADKLCFLLQFHLVELFVRAFLLPRQNRSQRRRQVDGVAVILNQLSQNAPVT